MTKANAYGVTYESDLISALDAPTKELVTRGDAELLSNATSSSDVDDYYMRTRKLKRNTIRGRHRSIPIKRLLNNTATVETVWVVVDEMYVEEGSVIAVQCGPAYNNNEECFVFPCTLTISVLYLR